jgi:hypothetical protein
MSATVRAVGPHGRLIARGLSGSLVTGGHTGYPVEVAVWRGAKEQRAEADVRPACWPEGTTTITALPRHPRCAADGGGAARAQAPTSRLERLDGADHLTRRAEVRGRLRTAVRQFRASVCVRGPLVETAAATCTASTLPGGDAIGSRPPDMHQSGAAAAGRGVFDRGTAAWWPPPARLRGAEIQLEYPVGGRDGEHS